METVPVVDWLGAAATIVLSLLTLKIADTPPKETFVAPVKPLPVIVTVVPAGPAVGEMLVITGPLVEV
jgi:hypothetical protein